MFRLTLKEVAAKKLRLITTAIAVMLGVAFMAGTLIFSSTIGRTFDGLLNDAYAGTDAYVRGISSIDAGFDAPTPRLDISLIDTIAEVDGVAAAEGHIVGYAQLIDADGDPIGNPGQGAPTNGHGWLSTPELNPYHLVEGAPPHAHGEIVIDRHSANIGDLAIGDTVTVMTHAGPNQFTITGIAGFVDADSAGGSSAVFFTPEDAQNYVADPGMVDAILVRAEEGTSQATITERIASVLPQDTEALTGAEITAEIQGGIKDNLSFIDTFLLVFAGIALFVGSFIIFNTFTIIVAQRQKETALLRAIGASRRQVTRAVMIEAGVVGLVASAAGLASGIGIATLLKKLLDLIGLDLPAGDLVVEQSTVIISLLVGSSITLLAAFIPARKAGKVPPIAAMREVAIDNSGNSKRRLFTGIGITAFGALALIAGLSGGQIALVGLGALVTFLGVAALAPVMARPAARLLGWPAKATTGMAGALARNNAMRNPRRTASTAAALMIGVGLVGFIAIFAESSKASINVAVDQDFHGDYVLDTGTFGVGGASHSLASGLAAMPEFDAVVSSRIWTAELDEEVTQLFSWDSAQITDVFDIEVLAGDTADLGTDGIALHSEYAELHDYSIGSPITVTFTEGARTLTVKALYDDKVWMGDYFVDHALTNSLGYDDLDMTVYIKTAAGTSDSAARAALDNAIAAHPTVELQTREEFKEARASEIDLILNLIYALLGLAIIIALMGIANTLALSIFERTRELGLLRAVGMTRSQLKAIVRFEAVIIALFGTALGLGIGTFFGWSMVQALASEGIGEFVIPTTTLLVVTAIAVVAGVAASILPGRRAAKLDVLKAISAQ